MGSRELFKNVKDAYSFMPENDYYKLQNLHFQSARGIIELINTLSFSMKNRSQLIFRGFSFQNEEAHDNFKNNHLNEFFVVGQKGNYYLKQSYGEFNENYQQISNPNRERRIKKINNLYEEISNIIVNKGKGILDRNMVENLDKLTDEELVQIEKILICLGHNIGNQWIGKSSSPILSGSYGCESKSIAKKFATNWDRQNRIDKGFIILGYIPKDINRFTLRTKELNHILEKLGVKWYEDIHHELMIFNGILPHHILGLFEVYRGKQEETFILNPWLNQLFISKELFDYKKGIPINQINFNDYAKKLNYCAYFTQIDNVRYTTTL